MIKIYISYCCNLPAVQHGLPIEMRITEVVADKVLETALKQDFAQVIGFADVAGNG